MQKVVIIIPCFNEARRLPVEQILSFLKQNENISVHFVNDGSTDDTGKIIDDAAAGCPDQITTSHLKHNSGKAQAIRQAMMEHVSDTQFDWLAYWDADLATPLQEIHHLLEFANGPIKLLMCSRVKRLGAKIDRHLHRHLIGRVMATLISNVLRLPVYDTQCGAKLIKQEEVETLFSEKFISRWLFDVEIIARIKREHSKDTVHNYILEVPVRKWQDVPGSKLKFKHMLLSLFELVKIYRKYKI
jgi:dolichyl-phosphate beta-glucosyltransferase